MAFFLTPSRYPPATARQNTTQIASGTAHLVHNAVNNLFPAYLSLG
nr:MAG TPA_asm: hypothetical protein [Caudoviricetes sp.]